MNHLLCLCGAALPTVHELLEHWEREHGGVPKALVIGEPNGYGRMRLTPAWRAAIERRRRLAS